MCRDWPAQRLGSESTTPLAHADWSESGRCFDAKVAFLSDFLLTKWQSLVRNGCRIMFAGEKDVIRVFADFLLFMRFSCKSTIGELS